MRTSRAFTFALAALVVGFFVARWFGTQPSNSPPASYDFGTLQKLASFTDYLQDTKQTNALKQFNDYLMLLRLRKIMQTWA
jgi:hypothetical protein